MAVFIKTVRHHIQRWEALLCEITRYAGLTVVHTEGVKVEVCQVLDSHSHSFLIREDNTSLFQPESISV